MEVLQKGKGWALLPRLGDCCGICWRAGRSPCTWPLPFQRGFLVSLIRPLQSNSAVWGQRKRDGTEVVRTLSWLPLVRTSFIRRMKANRSPRAPAQPPRPHRHSGSPASPLRSRPRSATTTGDPANHRGSARCSRPHPSLPNPAPITDFRAHPRPHRPPYAPAPLPPPRLPPPPLPPRAEVAPRRRPGPRLLPPSLRPPSPAQPGRAHRGPAQQVPPPPPPRAPAGAAPRAPSPQRSAGLRWGQRARARRRRLPLASAPAAAAERCREPLGAGGARPAGGSLRPQPRCFSPPARPGARREMRRPASAQTRARQWGARGKVPAAERRPGARRGLPRARGALRAPRAPVSGRETSEAERGAPPLRNPEPPGSCCAP